MTGKTVNSFLIAVLLVLGTQSELLAQSPLPPNRIDIHSGFDTPNVGANEFQDWNLRADISLTDGFAWIRNNAMQVSGLFDLRPRLFNKQVDNSGLIPIAFVDDVNYANSQSGGGSIHVTQPPGNTQNNASWYIWYGGRPMSLDLPGVDANTDRFSLYVWYENIDDYKELQLGTFLTDGILPAEANTGHYHYYHQTFPRGGTWLHVEYDKHPSHRRTFNGSQSPRNNPALNTNDPSVNDILNPPVETEQPYDYWANMIWLYFEIRRDQTNPGIAGYYLDDVHMYKTQDAVEPNQNDDSISSTWVGYFPQEAMWEIGWVDETSYYDLGMGRDSTTWSTYEVRWSTAPITNAIWNTNDPNVILPIVAQESVAGDNSVVNLGPGEFRKWNSFRNEVRAKFVLPECASNPPPCITLGTTSQVYFAIKDISVMNGHMGVNVTVVDGRNSFSNNIRTIDYFLDKNSPVAPTMLVATP